MKILSLFDWMSCGRIALERAWINVDQYYSSEIKWFAIDVTQHNYPDTIQLWDITKIDWTKLPQIDLIIGWSPCQDFSRANTKRDGLKWQKSMLFYEFIRLLKECKPKYFLLENVIMDDIWYNTISEELDILPIRICGSLVSWALRDRLYRTNIWPQTIDLFGHKHSTIPKPKDKNIKINDILEYWYSNKDKHTCLNRNCWRDASQRYMLKRHNSTGMTTIIYTNQTMAIDKWVRYCTQTELERLHNIPEWYTSIVNKTKAWDLIWDWWTVDVIAHIFSYIK